MNLPRPLKIVLLFFLFFGSMLWFIGTYLTIGLDKFLFVPGISLAVAVGGLFYQLSKLESTDSFNLEDYGFLRWLQNEEQPATENTAVAKSVGDKTLNTVMAILLLIAIGPLLLFIVGMFVPIQF